MTLRRRLLVLLLAITLVPLAVVVVHDHQAARQMGRDLADRGRTVLAERLADELTQAVGYASALVRRHKEVAELALVVQAREAARRLQAEAPPPALSRGPTPGPAAFEQGSAPGLRPSRHHRRQAGDGKGLPMRVSPEAPVFRPAPGVERAAVADPVARLSTLVHAFRGLRAGREDLFLWQYVSLESGLHVSYPGHGGYPADYDGRDRPWYRRAADPGGLVWSPPAPDATSGRLVATVSAPVRARDGSLLGVAGIDLDVHAMLAGLRDRATLPDEAVFLLADVATAGDGPGLRVLARQEAGGWRQTEGPRHLAPDAPQALAALLDDLAAGRQGMRRLPFDGVPALWGYAPVDAYDTALLVVLPTSEVAAEGRRAEKVVGAALTRQIAITGVFALLVAGVVAVLAVFAARRVTLPVQRLDTAARRLAEGDLEARADVTGDDELARLADTFNRMVPQLKDRLQMRQSLALAREVQESLLPGAPPAVPGLDLAAAGLPCDETGGDYHDFVPLADGRVAVVVGDVTGHGLPAALLMATARGLLRGQLARAASPAALLESVNRQLAADSRGGRFMTLILLEAAADGALRWCNAGHQPGLLYRSGEDAFVELGGGGVPLGIEAGWAYTDETGTDLPPGGLVVLATDGVTEARDATGAMFGRERLQAAVRTSAAGSAAEVRDAVLAALHAFRGDTPLGDDVTLAVVKRRSA